MPSISAATISDHAINGTSDGLPFHRGSPTAHKRVPSRPAIYTSDIHRRNVKEVVLGDLRFETWYSSFYPEDLIGRQCERLYVCKWCFRYTNDLGLFVEHNRACKHRTSGIVGTPVYAKDGLTICEIDGQDEKTFTQNLSLFAKLFLDTKSVFFDVTTFIYYVLYYTPKEASAMSNGVDHTNNQPRVVGYFSKEKLSWDGNNLACICVFPPWQKRGFGQVLMAASYQLSMWEERLGGPEKPLSELGRKAYIQYWSSTIARFIVQQQSTEGGSKRTITVQDISDATYILPEDIIMTLKEMNLLERRIAKKAPQNSKILINKAAVVNWMARNRVNMIDPVDSRAFIKKTKSETSND